MSMSTKHFDKRLQDLLTISGVAREELARRLGVAVPVVNRWLNGASVPDVYQFREIARFFGMPYEWFLDSGNGFPSTEELAEKLGLCEPTVRSLMYMAESDDSEVMSSVDNAIWAVLTAVTTVYKNLDRRIDRCIGGDSD